MRFVERQPVSYWLTYAALIVIEGLVVHLLSWIDGWLPVFTFFPMLLSGVVWQWAPLAIITSLNRVACEALESFNRLLKLDEAQLNRLRHEFTTMPARAVLISSVSWAVVCIIMTILAYSTLKAALGFGWLGFLSTFLPVLIAFSTSSVIYYHSFRQLWLVNRTVKLGKQFNLFRLDPVYAFSRVTAQTGASWMILLSLSMLTIPVEYSGPIFLGLLVLMGLLAVAAFVLPLWFVNRRLVSEKRRLQAEMNQRMEITLGRLHESLDSNDMAMVEGLHEAINALNTEGGVLSQISTWPWRTGTVTSFASALLLPIVLFLIQLGIERWLP